MSKTMYGSIEVSKVPKELFKKVTKADGSVGIFLNIAVVERKEPGKFGETHGVKFNRDKENRIENENTFFGSLKTYEPKIVTETDINNAPSVTGDDLPF